MPNPVPEWVMQGGAASLLGFVVLMILLGWLVPRRTYRALERERDHWREAALKAMGHTDQLMPAVDITAQVTKALSDAVTDPKQIKGS